MVKKKEVRYLVESTWFFSIQICGINAKLYVDSTKYLIEFRSDIWKPNIWSKFNQIFGRLYMVAYSDLVSKKKFRPFQISDCTSTKYLLASNKRIFVTCTIEYSSRFFVTETATKTESKTSIRILNWIRHVTQKFRSKFDVKISHVMFFPKYHVIFWHIIFLDFEIKYHVILWQSHWRDIMARKYDSVIFGRFHMEFWR